MNDLLRDIKTQLETLNLTPIWLESMPPKTTDAIVLYEYDAPAAFGRDGVDHGIARRNVQIRVRGETEFAMRVSDAIMSALVTGGTRANWPDGRTVLCNARSMPYRLDTLKDGKCIYACNYTIYTNRR